MTITRAELIQLDKLATALQYATFEYGRSHPDSVGHRGTRMEAAEAERNYQKFIQELLAKAEDAP